VADDISPAVHGVAADTLFASAAQRGDELSVSQIRQAITDALTAYGGAGCVGRVAQEFGDHPEPRPFECTGLVPRRRPRKVSATE
jgi:hypothetical protein